MLIFVLIFLNTKITIIPLKMRLPVYILLTIIGLGFSSAQKPVDILKNNALLKNASVSMLVKNLSTGRTVAELNSHTAVIPASTMKIVTTASAFELLGSDYTINTTLEIDGKIDSNGTLNGNLYINGAGDPTLGSEKTGDKNFLLNWANAVKAAGIKQINGNLIACEGCFEKQLINPGWTWEDIGNYYAPGIHGISYLDNTCKVVFRTGNNGSTPEIIRTEPEIPGLVFKNFVKSTSTKSDNAYFYGIPCVNERTIFGEIPSNRNEFISKTDIPHPAILLLADFKKALLDAGIKINGDLTTSDEKCKKFIVYTHTSPALSVICDEINHQSNNHYAEYIFKQLSLAKGFTGNSADSKSIIENFWKSKKLSVNELFQQDGCGLAPMNAVSANFFVELLTYMHDNSKNFDSFYSTLPVSGESGTLKNFLNGTPLSGKVHAKSGTISRVKSYTGYIEKDNQMFVFAVLINNAAGTSKEVTAKIEDFLLKVSSDRNQ